MNEGSGVLGTLGLLFCVGAIVLIAVAAFAMRRITGQPRTQRGPEEPRYDNPDVQSTGGFGMPVTGDRDVVDRDRVERDPTLGSSGFGGAQSYDPENKPRRKEDDDQVSSGGGFGRG